jgi:hypothetical protein
MDETAVDTDIMVDNFWCDVIRNIFSQDDIFIFDAKGCYTTWVMNKLSTRNKMILLRNCLAAGLLNDETSIQCLDADHYREVRMAWSRVAFAVEGVQNAAIASYYKRKLCLVAKGELPLYKSFKAARAAARTLKEKTETIHEISRWLNAQQNTRLNCPVCGQVDNPKTFDKAGLKKHIQTKHPWFVTRVAPNP